MGNHKIKPHTDLYICDPEKNKECKKSACQQYCFLTGNLEYAKRPLEKITNNRQVNELIRKSYCKEETYAKN